MTWMSIPEAARQTGLSEKTIRRKIGSGLLYTETEVHGAHHRKMVHADDLERLFGSLPGSATPAADAMLPDADRKRSTLTMTDPTARSIASVACCAACCLIAFAEPGYSPLCLIGMIGALYTIWS